jgi:hypothetical protein
MHHMEKTVTIEGEPHCQQVLVVPTDQIPVPPAISYPHYFRLVSLDQPKDRQLPGERKGYISLGAKQQWALGLI